MKVLASNGRTFERYQPPKTKRLKCSSAEYFSLLKVPSSSHFIGTDIWGSYLFLLGRLGFSVKAFNDQVRRTIGALTSSSLPQAVLMATPTVVVGKWEQLYKIVLWT